MITLAMTMGMHIINGSYHLVTCAILTKVEFHAKTSTEAQFTVEVKFMRQKLLLNWFCNELL